MAHQPGTLRRGFQSAGYEGSSRHEIRSLNGPIVVGGEINVALNVEQGIGKIREMAIKENPNSVFGTNLGINYANIAIGKGQPLLIEKRPLHPTGHEKLFPRRTNAFSSLVGLHIEEGTTQESFEERFQFAGISVGDVKDGINDVTEKQVGAHVAGAVPISWPTYSHITTGQPAVWFLNSINKEIRDQELMHMPSTGQRDKDNFGVLFRAMDPDEATGYITRAVTDRFEEVSPDGVDHCDFSILLNPDLQLAKRSNNARLGLMAAGNVMWSSLMGIVHAMERGWVVPSPKLVQAFTEGRNFNDAEVYGMFRQAELRGPVALQHNHAAITAVDKRAVAEFVKFLAGKHGLLGGPRHSPWGTAGSRLFIDTVVSRTLRGVVKNSQAYAAGDFSYLLGQHAGNVTQARGEAGLNHMQLESPAGYLDGYQKRIGADLYRSSVDILNGINSRIAGIMLDTPQPGHFGHMLLRIH